ncbi:MAG: AAA family ATPase [Gammaproteobacteria bacterium]|nr:AAA family ATPase [Gammaproteobacteria bacterium]
MYELFYGFKEKPFTLLPDPDFLYLGKRHSTALAMLEYGILNQAGFTVISGEIGSGKTTLVRHILNRLDPAEVTIGLIDQTHPTFGDLMQWVLAAFEIQCASTHQAQIHQAFLDFMIREYQHGRRTVLIIDEAQNMSLETLEELRMLSNINADKHFVLQMVLVGQPELRQKLQSPALAQFAQRIAVDYHIAPLDLEETKAYIEHRIRHAEGDPALFQPGTHELIHEWSQGVPRLINMLCDMVLVYGYAGGALYVDEALVQEAIRDKEASGLQSHVRKRGPESKNILASK